MASERMRRQLGRLLDDAEAAVNANEWALAADKARAALAIEADNADALTFVRMAEANLGAAPATEVAPTSEALSTPLEPTSPPASFVGGRYEVRRFLGEGGKKRVFLAHDTLLDRDVAFSLIKTESLDQPGRERVMREARAMGRLTHPHIVSIYDIGEHMNADGASQPYLVQELMGGGDVEGLLEQASGPLPLPRALRIATEVSRGLEYAHRQGVVHRDLKPGNVWLTADGTAKIGDLGLAVQLGQSRLTTHGMMVGTYQYMPPEQALGGEITPQADLYSLGAMLYELVTGRTPFEGDTPTAVISQHLNAQPVAPSWHSEHCPPDLEALILRLLEKEPGKRPASATEVRAALEQVDPQGRSASHSDSQANPLDRLARGVFVGRERELEQLRDALNAAMEGRGSVVMLVGEPGIGKTRTVQELETYARMRGANVYWGRTHESSGMPPYWPWVQIGRAWGASHDLTQLAANPELLRLFPDLPRFAPAYAGLEPPEQRDPAMAQFLLFDAYTQFVRAQAQQTPWVIVLDDLHWADKPTLQLLQYLARELPNMPLLVVGTYRDTDLVRTHPLSEALAELNREHGFLRVNLRGLSREEVASYVRQRAAARVPDALLDRVYEETEGNPFFLSEVVNLMTQEGTLTATSISDLALPDGVREALGRRLDRVSEETNELLRVAAVVGREFAYDVLQLLDERTDDELLRAIEEALDARVIEELPEAGRYRFMHALMQETLLEELSTTRRVRIHGQVGEALERRWGARADERAARLARHFVESSTLTDAHREKALRYSVFAAKQAEAQSAWAEGLRHRENVVALTDENDQHALAHSLEELGRIAQLAVEWRLSWRTLLRALDVLREVDDGVGFARCAELLAWIAVEGGRVESILREALERLEGRDSELEGLVLAQLLRLEVELVDEAELAAQLEERIQQTASDSLRLRGLFVRAQRALAAGEASEGVALRRECRRLSEELGDSRSEAQAATGIGQALMSMGALDDALEALAEAIRLCERFRNRQYAGFANQWVATIYWARGDFEKFRAAVDSIPEENFAREQLTGFLLSARGAPEATLHMPPADWRGNVAMMAAVHGGRVRVLFHAGDQAKAVDALKRWRETHGWVGARRDITAFWGALVMDEALAGILSQDEVVQFLSEVERVPQGEQRLVGHAGSLDRLKGQLHLAAGQPDEARRLAARAIEWCTEQRATLELARAQQLLADIELAEGNREAALALLDSAASTFDRLGLRLYLDQVIAKKDILKA